MDQYRTEFWSRSDFGTCIGRIFRLVMGKISNGRRADGRAFFGLVRIHGLVASDFLDKCRADLGPASKAILVADASGRSNGWRANGPGILKTEFVVYFRAAAVRSLDWYPATFWTNIRHVRGLVPGVFLD